MRIHERLAGQKRPRTIAISLLAAQVFFFFQANAQSQLCYQTINFADSANAFLWHRSTDNLCKILIDGYLKEKLSGYVTDFGTTTEYELVPASAYPDPWEAKKEYWYSDVVMFNNLVYEAIVDAPDRALNPAENADGWVRINLSGKVKRTVKGFSNSILSKTEFVNRMLESSPELPPQWERGFGYYAGERVSFNGRSFEAIVDDPGGNESPDNRDYWQQYDTGPDFFRASDLFIVKIAGVKNKKSFSPQMITILNPNSFSGIVSFYYDEVISYLDTIQEPLLYETTAGDIGGREFVIDWDAEAVLRELVRASLKSKVILPQEITVRNSSLFHQFNSDSIYQKLSWGIWQSFDLSTLEIVRIDEKFESVLSIPVSLIQKRLTKKSKTSFMNYRAAFEGNKFSFVSDCSEYDSVAGRKNKLSKMPKPKQFSMMQNYSCRPDTSMQVALLTLWPDIAKSFYDKTLTFKSPYTTIFDCKYNWDGTEIHGQGYGWILNSYFSIEASNAFQIDSVENPIFFPRLGVTYKRVINSGNAKGPKPLPVEITFFLTTKENEFPISYTVAWQEFKTKFSSTVPAVIEHIENGTLNFDFGEVVYGLTEEKF